MLIINSEMRLYAPMGDRLYINEDERKRFLLFAKRSPPSIRSLCLVLAYTGCRVSEALSLTPASIHFTSNVIAIRSLKKRDRNVVREIPVPELLLQVLAEDHGIKTLGNEWQIDRRYLLWPICRSTAWRQVKAVMDCADISGPQSTPKGLRHGYGVHALHSGVPLNMLQKWMGHAHISTTAIYGNATGPEEQDIAARMW